MKTKRVYTMTARAQATDRTRVGIIDAAVRLASIRLLADISLEDVAAEAGVTVRTVLRHFGNRKGLIEAATAHARAQVDDERRVPVGDVRTAITNVVDHYERRGDGVVLMLAQESTDPQVARITDGGRDLHRDWVETTFAPYLPESGAARAELVDLLIVSTDVYTWKLLRRDRGLDRSATEQRMLRLVSTLVPLTSE
ncbi:TetR/AcrR family transcriptional regulator [Gordonia crocea]|uniref:HTH tetR-type domain-containing protein n=1 Tax=Gordonia crocea TaxID=589162 RepID=A0A7M3STW5_9ACTN|nr:TetR/AcrR family transcriptional regulator [Gordonia crocea]GED96089.1 hypothetical protein nbrc107697_01280 [Gordonia crocea]